MGVVLSAVIAGTSSPMVLAVAGALLLGVTISCVVRALDY
jgi:hypothetical protein